MKRLFKAHQLAISGNIVVYEDNETMTSFYCRKNKKEGYDVICQDGLWTCNCPDYYHRNNYQNSHLCKHILGCIMWVALERSKGQTEFRV